MFNLVTSSTLRRRKGDRRKEQSRRWILGNMSADGGDESVAWRHKNGSKNVFIKRTYYALYYRDYAKTFKKL